MEEAIDEKMTTEEESWQGVHETQEQITHVEWNQSVLNDFLNGAIPIAILKSIQESELNYKINK